MYISNEFEKLDIIELQSDVDFTNDLERLQMNSKNINDFHMAKSSISKPR